MVKTVLPLPGARVRSLVQELRSHMPRGNTNKQNQKASHWIFFKWTFIFLAVPRISCSTRDLCGITQHLPLPSVSCGTRDLCGITQHLPLHCLDSSSCETQSPERTGFSSCGGSVALWHVGILVPQQRWNPHPLHCKADS